MLNQQNFNGDVSILRGSCHSIEKDFDRKIQQTKNFLRQTTLSLQKISDSKPDLFLSSTNINGMDSPTRKVSITKHKGISALDSETKLSQGLVESKNASLNNSSQTISQNPSNFFIAAGGIIQGESSSKIYSAQNQSFINDAQSSKCSIQMDIKCQENSKEQENPFMVNEEFCIDGENDLEKRIHKWLDEQGVRMANPGKKHYDYFDQKRSQILIMHKKKHFTQNALVTSCNITGGEIYLQSTQSMQNSEKFISYSYNASPQKMYRIESQPQGESHQNQKSLHMRTPHLGSSGSDIIISTLFNNQITDSPLMQRRKLMQQNAQDRDTTSQASEKKPSNLSLSSVNPANNQMKSSLAHLSQYKRSNPTKSNNEIISSEISTDCK